MQEGMASRFDAFPVTLSEFVRRNSGRLTISAARTNVVRLMRRTVRPSGIPFGQFRIFALAHAREGLIYSPLAMCYRERHTH